MGQRFQKVRGGTLEEAYRRMRAKYGLEAVVVSTRQVTEGGFLGYFGRQVVEITASVPIPESAPRAPSPVERKYAEQSLLADGANKPRTKEEFEQLIRDAQRRMQGAPRPAASGASPVVAFPKRKPEPEALGDDVRRELQDIREMMQVLYAEHPGAGLPTEFAPHYRALVSRGVSRKAAAALIGLVLKDAGMEVLREPRVFAERLHFVVRGAIKTTGGIALHGGECRLVALAGPTGVGKTTNLAKLAAHFAVHERARVALLTCDTFRVAAVEQLRVYANIIGIPLRVANDAKDAAEAMKQFQDYDLVLMDTAGGSQFNLEQINELKAVLHAARPHEVMLVLSAATHMDDLRSVVSNFKCLQPASLLFTKLDETRQYGSMLNMLLEAGLPLSYVSVGQNVPDDIRVAAPGMIANLVLEGRNNRGGSSAKS